MARLVRFARTSPALSKPRLHKGRSFNLKLQTRGHPKEGKSNGQPKLGLRKVRRSIGQYDERQLMGRIDHQLRLARMSGEGRDCRPLHCRSA